MHHAHVCLLPAEILCDIFTAIHKNGSKPNSRATVAALARTCRTFQEPALDVLWRDIEGFKPLLSCLPEGVVIRTTEGKLTLKRFIFAGEWKIFGQYTLRIHSLTIDVRDLNTISDQVVQAFMSTPSSLFPNLRRLHWSDDRDCFFPLLRTLIVPTIRSMTLRSTFRPWSTSFAKSALLASLGARCPSIQRFNCAYSGHPEDTSAAICEAVCGWRDLVHLATGVLNTQALAHLASLPSLKSLHFRSYDFVDDLRPKPILTFISELEEMFIGATSLSHLTRCLKNLPSLSCRSVRLRINRSYSEVPYDPVDITDLIVSFSECFSPALEQLDVEFGFDCEALSEDVLANSHFAFGFDVIAPLLPFSRLTKLDLDWFCTSHVDDDALKDMVQSWPQLDTFSFGTKAPWLISPSLTFVGLVHLIQHCRHLRRINMSFRAFPIDTNSEPFSITIPNENVISLFVGISPIDDAMAVACQLHTLMPKLAVVDHWIDDRDQNPRFGDEWEKAEQYLQVLTKGAKMREELAQGSQVYVLPG